VRPLPNRRAKTKTPYAIEKDGFRATYYEMAGQYGTHVDPPAQDMYDDGGLPAVVGELTRGSIGNSSDRGN
jgi:hypothetical protein